MTYKEETFILNTLQELRDFIRSPEYTRLMKETHENNIMLRKLLAIEYSKIRNHHRENEDDFGRNILANIISNIPDLKRLI